MNLAGLGVERVETVVAPANLELMGFFYSAGFTPSERLSFLKQLWDPPAAVRAGRRL
jgi:hypothetical protein